VFGAVEISESLQQALDAFFEFLPNLLGFLVILIVGYLIAKAVKALVGKGLQAVGLDRALSESDAGRYVEKVSPGARPSNLISAVVFWLIFLFVLTAAIGALEIPAVTAFMDEVLGYLPNVIAAVVIFVVAAAIAGAVSGLIDRLIGDTATGRLLRAAAPSLIMVIAVFMILNQLEIAEEIVTITYASILGALALGMALAFGLGGRGVAGRMLEDAYDRREGSTGDVGPGVRRAQQRAGEAEARVPAQQEPGAPLTPPPPGTTRGPGPSAT
jgi:hypothetical protein